MDYFNFDEPFLILTLLTILLLRSSSLQALVRPCLIERDIAPLPLAPNILSPLSPEFICSELNREVKSKFIFVFQ